MKNETREQKRQSKMIDFYKGLKSEIDLPYFSDGSHESFDDLRDAIEDGNGFDVEIICYSTAIEYLKENDPSLRESLEIASDMGYEAKNINSELLASLLASQNSRTEFEALETEITDFFEDLNKEFKIVETDEDGNEEDIENYLSEDEAAEKLKELEAANPDKVYTIEEE